MTEYLHSLAEQCPDGSTMIARLREARWKNAEDVSSREMSRMLTDADRIANPTANFLRIEYDNIPITAHINPSEQLALEGVGIDASQILRDGIQTELGVIEGSDARVRLVREGSGLAYKLSYDDASAECGGTARFDDEQRAAIRGRYEQSPGHIALHEALQTLTDNTDPPEELTVSTFNLVDDPLGSIVLLNSFGVGVQDAYQYTRELKRGATPQTVLAGIIEKDKAPRIESDDFIRLTARGGSSGAVSQTVFIDKHTNDCTITIRQVPERAYVETANQAGESISSAFIDTECAKEMLGVLAAQGLMLNPEIQKVIITSGQADRYGSVYTQMSREIAKWVNDPGRLRVRDLFVPYDEDFFGENVEKFYHPGSEYEFKKGETQGTEAIENRARYAVTTLDTTNLSEAAGVLLGLAKETVQRRDTESALQVTDEEVALKGYACFDAAGHYIDGAAAPVGFTGVIPYTENGVSMLKKSNGGKTYLLRDKVLFNGVGLPKGSLMTKGDSGWFFQRLTPFTFDTFAGVAATGSEVAKVETYGRSAIAGLGGASLRHLELGAELRARYGADK